MEQEVYSTGLKCVVITPIPLLEKLRPERPASTNHLWIHRPLTLDLCSFCSLYPSGSPLIPNTPLSPNYPATTQTPCFLSGPLPSAICVIISASPMRRWSTINVVVSIILRSNSGLGAQAQPSRPGWGTGGTLPLRDGPNRDTLFTGPANSCSHRCQAE